MSNVWQPGNGVVPTTYASTPNTVVDPIWAPGVNGARYIKGDKGATGEPGPKGDTGEKGDQGETGDTGDAVALEAHIVAAEPHQAYDDIQSLSLFFENQIA